MTTRRFGALSVIAPVSVVVATVLQLSLQTGSARQPTPAAVVFTGLLAVSLVARLRWPTTVFALVVAVAFAQWLADVRLVADVAVLIALFTVAARSSVRSVVAAVVVVEIGVVAAVARWDSPDTWTDSLVLLTGLTAAATFAGVAQRNHRAALAAALARSELAERDRANTVAIELAAERSRIAREMHDVVAHGLSIMVTMSDAAIVKLDVDHDQAASAMRQVSATGRDAMADMRRLLDVLRPDATPGDRRPQPGLDDIDALVAQVRRAGVPIDARIDCPTTLVGQGVALTVYRVVQEALTNVVKHAVHPARVELAIAYDDDKIVVCVDDDGRSTNPIASENRSTGHGLAGMRERVAGYGGTVDAGPGAVSGWQVRVIIPVQGVRS